MARMAVVWIRRFYGELLAKRGWGWAFEFVYAFGLVGQVSINSFVIAGVMVVRVHVGS
jgi:hypothetical protein